MPIKPHPPQTDAAQLLAQMMDLRARIDLHSRQIMAGWQGRIHRAEFMASAQNMADWLALRQHDLTGLQEPLARLGLSSLGRMEAHVAASLQAVTAALSRIAGQHGVAFPPDAAFAAGAGVLEARRDALLGAQDADDPQTRVMVTLPTMAGTDGGALIAALVAAGLDCVRINCAHDGPEVWNGMITALRAIEARTGRHFPVTMDLGGPKFRVVETLGDRGAGGLRRLFVAGDRFALVKAAKDAPPGMFAACLSDPGLVDALVPGANVSIDDGKLWAKVERVAGCCAELVVTRTREGGAKIKPEKGINLPGSDLRVAALTTNDLAALDFVVGHADVVSYSFVQTRADVAALITAMRERLAPGAPLPGVVLKIETPMGLRNLPDLIIEAGGSVPVAVMIARGDLAVEIGFDRLSEIQEEMLWLCEAAQVPVVWATQVLEGLVKGGQVSRAEVTDAAMSQRADCVMLNKGPHVVEAVAFLRGILARMDRHQTKKSPRLVALGVWAGSQS
jgi:pyruvate kinase